MKGRVLDRYDRFSPRQPIIAVLALLALASSPAAPGAPWDHRELGVGNGAGQELYDKYKALEEDPGLFKVFVLSSDNAVAFATEQSYKAALNAALGECNSQSTESSFGCRVFAVGDTIVWDLPTDETEAVIARYAATKKPGTRMDRLLKILADVLRDVKSTP